MSTMVYNFEAIGYVHIDIPAKKYQLSRQPNLKEDSLELACIELLPHRDFEKALEDLEGFSHIWILFWMDRVQGYKPKVRPPRMNRKCGLFSTRSPHRPNPIGLSCVKLISVKGRKLWIQGCDMLDKTPILDIKPYLAFQESHPQAVCGWLDQREKESLVFWKEGLYDALMQKRGQDSYLDPESLERRLRVDPVPSSYNRLLLEDAKFEIASGKWRFRGSYQKIEGQKTFFIESVDEAP